MVAPLRIVFFGTPQFAVPTLERILASRHALVGLVTQPDRPRGRGHRVSDAPVKALAVQRGLALVQPARLRDPEVENTLRRWEPDLAVVAAYGKIIPDHLLAVPRLGMINVHASLLPKYRGAAPVHRAVMAGEPVTGVTIMRVGHELDAGAMFGKAIRPIAADETSVEVERDLAVIGAELLARVVEEIAAGTAREEPQDHSQATYAPKLTREEGLIDWSQPARAIHDRVRGLHPWPHAHTFLSGSRLIVLRTRVQAAVAHPQPPGSVFEVSRDALHVMAGDGCPIAIEKVQPEGKRPMTVRDFLAGHSLTAGVRLGDV
jgi:methionyl-tRNA formyltransferase